MPDLIDFWSRLNPFEYPGNWLDILVVALLFWWLLNVIRGTRAVQLLRGVTVLLIASFVIGEVLNLQTLQWLLSNVIQPALIVAIPVLFQPELRRALETIGRTSEVMTRRPFGASNNDLATTVTVVTRAAVQLAQQQTGALMVIERNTGLQEYADRGVILDARLSVPLLLNIFYENAPLHDLAVIIRGTRILAANAVLPLSEHVAGATRYGSRHRAALGISEVSDAIAVVVSEESGSISVATNGRMVRHLSEARLRRLLAELLNVPLEEGA
ncbi:diadenylate cyclase CdaA [Kallotenue papyrolyticum]|uniref:diadenylate cyclase CdaA n=1 Tax=Kallotenue papyrolyticum TaxID=1325125 RepID=UPI00049265A9|nr:diadenylate cyclase CdaA [Kallotenue papyrolyticum]